MKPVLPVPNGRLRPSRESDLDNLMRLLRDPQVRRYLCDDIDLPRETVAEMLTRSDELDAQGLGLWVIEGRQGDFAGIAGLEPVSAEAATTPAMAGGVEPVVALHPGHWGQGLAGAALTSLIGHARDTLRLLRLVGAVDLPNEASHRLMRRGGFTVMGKSAGPAHELVLYQLQLGD